MAAVCSTQGMTARGRAAAAAGAGPPFAVPVLTVQGKCSGASIRHCPVLGSRLLQYPEKRRPTAATSQHTKPRGPNCLQGSARCCEHCSSQLRRTLDALGCLRMMKNSMFKSGEMQGYTASRKLGRRQAKTGTGSGGCLCVVEPEWVRQHLHDSCHEAENAAT